MRITLLGDLQQSAAKTHDVPDHPAVVVEDDNVVLHSSGNVQ